MTSLDYSKMSFEEIHDDLLATASDLYYNGGVTAIKSVLVGFETIDENATAVPSEKLVKIMTDLYVFDANLTASTPMRLMREAVGEMVVLSPKPPTAG